MFNFIIKPKKKPNVNDVRIRRLERSILSKIIPWIILTCLESP